MNDTSSSVFPAQTNSSLSSPKFQNSKFCFSSMTTQQPQIYGEQPLDHRYHQYIGSNNLETLLNAIEASPVNLSSRKFQMSKQGINITVSHDEIPDQRTYNQEERIKFGEQQIHRLLPPPISKNLLTPDAMSISSLIDSDKPIKSSIPLTPPDTSLAFPGLSSSPTKSSPATSPVPLASILPSAPMSVPSPTDSIPFPRLQPSPPANIFLNTFPLPSVNQAIGDVDRTRSSPPPLIQNNNSPHLISNKRKCDSIDSSLVNTASYLRESRTKIRRSIGDPILQNPSYPSVDDPSLSTESSPKLLHCQNDAVNSIPFHFTTITCYHASVAQKSYGSEKRFLCPPPVVTLEKPSNSCRNLHVKPEVSMSVVCGETGERSLEQRAMLDENMKGTFKYLHVSGTAKAKHFTLKLKIFHKNSSIPYAVFDSDPVTIISKPSKKTAKARNISSCISSGDHISLFNRINSQTVRTKYMGIESGELCAKNSTWSSFAGSFSPTNSSKGSSSPISSPGSPSPNSVCSKTQITYGSEVVLSDPTTGFISDHLIIRKVEKGRIAQGACGPVSQMQKIALQCVRMNGRESHYLSAAGPITMDSPQLQDQCTVSGASPFLGYQSSRVVHMQNVDFAKEPFRMVSMQNIPCSKSDTTSTIVEEVDDYLCWTIVGISKFQYQYTYYENYDACGI
ncbi:37_t:CDS:2 [Scutellospora calospora]|uniref:37_t:CDS:1 n=1 Tax=Scutellospora calospora TaxID=85575 RepID=A0ACA9L1E7_9GLOM|nr:37_t:CDS:2 [Scutellospora calospora]